jgi:hypothetical protein
LVEAVAGQTRRPGARSLASGAVAGEAILHAGAHQGGAGFGFSGGAAFVAADRGVLSMIEAGVRQKAGARG